jgi:hypothetical protein
MPKLPGQGIINHSSVIFIPKKKLLMTYVHSLALDREAENGHYVSGFNIPCFPGPGVVESET